MYNLELLDDVTEEQYWRAQIIVKIYEAKRFQASLNAFHPTPTHQAVEEQVPKQEVKILFVHFSNWLSNNKMLDRWKEITKSGFPQRRIIYAFTKGRISKDTVTFMEQHENLKDYVSKVGEKWEVDLSIIPLEYITLDFLISLNGVSKTIEIPFNRYMKEFLAECEGLSQIEMERMCFKLNLPKNIVEQTITEEERLQYGNISVEDEE